MILSPWTISSWKLFFAAVLGSSFVTLAFDCGLHMDDSFSLVVESNGVPALLAQSNYLALAVPIEVLFAGRFRNVHYPARLQWAFLVPVLEKHTTKVPHFSILILSSMWESWNLVHTFSPASIWVLHMGHPCNDPPNAHQHLWRELPPAVYELDEVTGMETTPQWWYLWVYRHGYTGN